MVAPLDRRAGGTWLGVGAHGVFAALTNLASGSTDSCVIIWDMTKKLKKVKYMNVHNNGDVQGVAWLDETTVLSTGMDSVVKKMTVTMP